MGTSAKFLTWIHEPLIVIIITSFIFSFDSVKKQNKTNQDGF